jgi:large subunit ribosomal protein L13
MRLRGKHKPQFTPHVDCGDRIIVINAEQVTMTGNKLDQDILYRHTGHSGGIKSESSRQILEGRHPQRRWKKAVQRMMPRNLLCRDLVRKNLYVYAGPTHPHAAQKPEFLDVASFNSKNVKRPAT